jgi:L-amino acid N-acyltransferase YncA
LLPLHIPKRSRDQFHERPFMEFVIDTMQRNDWSRVRAIYGEGLATGMAAFRLSPPKWEAWNAGYLPIGRSVAREADGNILGWSALAPVPDT